MIDNSFFKWCNMYGITPTEYDNESLSYFQMMSKVLYKINELEKIFTCYTSKKVTEIIQNVLGNATYDVENKKIIFSFELNVADSVHTYNLEKEEIKIEREDNKNGCFKIYN